jgi:alanine-synthesizing transaminase
MIIPSFSSRLPLSLESNRLASAVARRRASGAPLIDLTASNPTTAGFDYPPDLLAELASPRNLVYEPDAAGALGAREAVAEALDGRGDPVTAGDIILTASTSEAYGHLFKLLCEPADDVLVPQPSYPLFEWLTRLDSVVSIPYRLEYHGRWTIDVDALAAAVTTRTKAFLLVNPNNPTGSYVTRAEFARIAEVAPMLPLIGDEVFWDFPLDEAPADRASVLESGRSLVFSLGGLSKSAGLPQLKLGWIAIGGDRSRVDAARAQLELIADTYLSVSTPVQTAARGLLAAGAEMRAQIVARASRNLARLRETVEGRPALNLLRAEGGWSAIVRVPATRAEEDLVIDLVEKDGVLVHPGYFFDFAREAYVVVSLIAPPGDFDRGIAAIAERF